jgi:acid phosphatase type 7
MQSHPGGRTRRYGRLLPPSEKPIIRQQPDTTTQQKRQPLPTPTGSSPYHLSLDQVLSPAEMQAIQSSGRLVFHIIGDTGGVKTPQDQEIVATHMEQYFAAADPATRPSFFYHLGDVVYYYGQAGDYYSQYYEPYMHYNAPILGIPGNHDGDVLGSSAPSLAAFVENFAQRNRISPAKRGIAGVTQ